MGRLIDENIKNNGNSAVEQLKDYPVLIPDNPNKGEDVIFLKENWYPVSVKGLWKHFIDYIILRIFRWRG